MESSAEAEILSLKAFVRNVVDFEGLDSELMAAAQAELGSGASSAEVADRGGGLLLEALLSVGIDPKTELAKRDLLKQALHGDLMSEADLQFAVEYVLSQMIVQPKAHLAECLAIPACVRHLDALKAAGRLPADVQCRRGVWARRALLAGDAGGVSLAEWREAADMIFCAPATRQMKFEVGQASSRRGGPVEGDLLVFGAAEVKCFRKVRCRELAAQFGGHFARLAGGLQLRDPRRRSIEREYLPSQLWYAIPTADSLYVVCAEDRPFLARHERSADKFLTFTWTDPALSALIRLSIGPKYMGAGSRRRRSPDPFGAVLPYGEDDLEEMGLNMAYYTLGAMADQPDVDLRGDEWSYYLERALSSVTTGLSQRQVDRRNKMLSRLG